MSENIENITTSDNTFAPNFVNFYPLSHAKFGGNCLVNSNIPVLKKVINLYISYTLDRWSRDLSTDFTLGNCLIRAVKLTKNVDLINMDIVVMVLDSIHVHGFHYQTVAVVKMPLF